MNSFNIDLLSVSEKSDFDNFSFLLSFIGIRPYVDSEDICIDDFRFPLSSFCLNDINSILNLNLIDQKYYYYFLKIALNNKSLQKCIKKTND